jgi:hypothetical protein
VSTSSAQPPGAILHPLTTPRAAALAGVLSALLFAAVLILIRAKMPEGVGDSTQWLNSERGGIVTATKLMPFAGITFLWFIAVVRDGFGRYEDRFFATVFLGSGLLFLAVMFRLDRGRRSAGGQQLWHHRSRSACRGDRVRQGDRGVGRQNLRHQDGGGVHDFAGSRPA